MFALGNRFKIDIDTVVLQTADSVFCVIDFQSNGEYSWKFQKIFEICKLIKN